MWLHTHEHTDGRLMKLGGGLMKRQQFSQSELLIQAIFDSPFAHTVCITIPLHTQIPILTHSQTQSICALSNGSHFLTHTHAKTFHPPRHKPSVSSRSLTDVLGEKLI